MNTEHDALSACFERIDAVNSQDPKRTSDGQPANLLYGLRMSECLATFQPDASPALQIAVRAQHIERWHIPRASYPMDRAGYLSWRRALAQHHAEKTGQIMADLNYNETDIAKVKQLLRKQKLKQDPDTQSLEDVACLVFLRFYFSDFAQQHSEEKIISIVQKTWRKMSAKGQQSALKQEYSAKDLALLQQALASA